MLGRAAAAGVALRELDDLSERLFVDQPLVDQLLDETRQRLEADRPATVATGVLLAAADLAVAARRYEIAEDCSTWPCKEPDDLRATARMNWGLDLLIDRQYAQAVAVFRRVVEDERLADREAQSRYFLARALAWSGDIDQALAEAETVASAFADLPRSGCLPASILHYAKRYAESEQAYRPSCSASTIGMTMPGVAQRDARDPSESVARLHPSGKGRGSRRVARTDPG
jgi:tetratricopeptide (TPR) repeat protein